MPHGSLVDKTASSLLDRVLDGRFPADRPLPSQDQLADALGVSRLTVREAVKSLTQSGILRVEHGNGTFVNPTDQWTDIAAISRSAALGSGAPRALLEVRRMIELGAAELCATRADAGVLASLDAHLEAMDAANAAGDVAGFVRHDIDFHDAILRGTGNPFVAAIYDPLRSALEHGRTQTSAFPEIRAHAQEQHRSVRAAIASGDPGRARAAMSAHMDQTLADLEDRVRP